MSTSRAGDQGVDREQAQRRRAVDEDVVEAAPAPARAGTPPGPGAAGSRGPPARPARSRRRPGRWSAGAAEQTREVLRPGWTTSASGRPVDQDVVDVGVPGLVVRTPSAVEALPCGSRSTTSTRSPCRASAAARLTVVVVLPTPPFWFATVMHPGGRGGGEVGRPDRPAPPPRSAAARGDRGVDVRRLRFHVKHRPRTTARSSGHGRPARSDRPRSPCLAPGAVDPDDRTTAGRSTPTADGRTSRARPPPGQRRQPPRPAHSRRAAPPSWPAAAARAQQRDGTSRPAGPAGRPRGRSPRRRPDRARRTLLGPGPDHASPWSRPSSSTTSARNVARRSSGSTRVTCRSGRARPARARAARPRSRRRPRARPGATSSPSDGAVQQVPVPQPRHLAGADQPALAPRRRPAARRSARAPASGVAEARARRRTGRAARPRAVSRETSTRVPAPAGSDGHAGRTTT